MDFEQLKMLRKICEGLNISTAGQLCRFVIFQRKNKSNLPSVFKKVFRGVV